MYTVFVRNWWKKNSKGQLEPHLGRKKTIRRNIPTIEEAREICRSYNNTHDPGKLSRKAEFMQQ